MAFCPAYPEFADGIARLHQRHPPFLCQDLLDGLQDPRGHGDIAANVDVALALAQDFEDVVRQVQPQQVLYIGLGGSRQRARGGLVPPSTATPSG